jgi:DNA-binding CsgD family transcriptional regulator
MSQLPLIVFATDARGVFTIAAGAGLKVLGRKQGEAVGKNAADLYADNPVVLAAIRRALAGEQVTYRAAIKGRVWESIYIPQFGPRGALIGTVGAAFDVTDEERWVGTLGELIQARVNRLSRAAQLSAREEEVLDLMLLGRTRSDVALALGISERTAKYHVEKVLQKLGAESRVDLLRIVLQTGSRTKKRRVAR